MEVVLRKACDKRLELMANIPEEKRCGGADEILNDPDIDVVVELIGGYEPARTFILKALENRKHVVTANKAVLAKHWDEVFSAAKKAGKMLGFEASVAGSIPIINTLGHYLDRITRVRGILNGTCNFILTKMEEGVGYQEALKTAQEKGFAEADPSFDVDGHDSSQKLYILSRLIFGDVNYDDISVKGVRDFGSGIIANALNKGSVIRLVASAEKKEGVLEMKVEPVEVPKSDILASVRDEYNAVSIEGENFGTQVFIGKGAGKRPTADAVVRDIVGIARSSV
ncbi:MAG: homoserine dehydrogenase [Candidatus Thorarchaeota archaeon]